MPITDIHLRTFLDRLDSIRENLHLRPLTDREVEAIIKAAGFTTTDPGVGGNYNVLFDAPWKNVKIKPYKELPFSFKRITPLIVECIKHKIKSTKLDIIVDFEAKTKYILDILLDASSKGFSKLVINKDCRNAKKVQKLQIITGLLTDFVNTLTLNMDLITPNTYPINVSAWVKRNVETKLRVFLPTLTRESIVLQQPLYSVGDVGTISEIEELDILEAVEIVDAIRH